MKNKTQEIIKAGLIAGTLDILAANIYVYIKSGKPAVTGIFHYIAGGLFGKDRSLSDGVMTAAGLILHYLIAFIWTIFFFWIYPKVKVMSANRVVTAVVYGLVVWFVMNRIVVPLTNLPTRPFNLTNALINMCILILCIGVPVTFIASRYYKISLRKVIG